MRASFEQKPNTLKSKSKPNQRSASSDATNARYDPSDLAGYSPSHKKSILKRSIAGQDLATRHSRSDSYGNQIKEGGKKHKITFKDGLFEVMEVESWKQYNQEDPNYAAKNCCNIM